jgi:hypothetical protein
MLCSNSAGQKDKGVGSAVTSEQPKAYPLFGNNNSGKEMKIKKKAN